jgi:hypothetical protein
MENFAERRKVVPRTFMNALKKIEIFESDRNAVHRTVFENDEVHNRQRQKGI